MSRPPFPDSTTIPTTAAPEDLALFVDWWTQQPNGRERFRWTLREALDQLLDGRRTGRWAYQHLSKTEKTHFGTVVEIELTREFQIPDGSVTDWKIGGEEIDCKVSKDFGKWSIPKEMYLCEDHGDRAGTANHAALVVWLSNDLGQWAAGVVRITDEKLSWSRSDPTKRSQNGDGKRVLSADGLASVHWLWGGRQDDLPSSALLTMTAGQRTEIYSAGSGQQRINTLFSLFPGVLHTRSTVAAVAVQEDFMKRPRDARLPKNLGSEGFLVLGHQDADPIIARVFGLPVPTKGEFVSCRVKPTTSDTIARVWIDGGWWTLADDDDPVFPAPQLPTKKPSIGWADYLKA